MKSGIKNSEVNHREIYEEADSLLNKVDEIREKVIRKIRIRNEVNAALTDLPNTLRRIEKGIPHAEQALSEIKRKHHPDVWKKIETALEGTTNLIEWGKKNLSSAAEMNSMDKQDFERAEQKIQEVRRTAEAARQNVDSVFGLKEELHNAKNKTPALLDRAKARVREAGRKVKESDVEYDARNHASRAKQKLRQAEEIYSKAGTKEIINWILLASLLGGAISLADKAIVEAKRDVEEAEEERERRRRRRRRDERDSYNRSSSWGGGGGGGGGFGGGGGGSGGGGAGGGW